MQTVKQIENLLNFVMHGLAIVDRETLEETKRSKQSIARKGFEDSLQDFMSENGFF